MGVADVVYGSRFVGSNPHRVLFFWHTIGNKFLTFLSNMFTNLNLTTAEINDLVAFVEHALYDPNLERYVPDDVFSGNCIPNADTQSQIDLGCN